MPDESVNILLFLANGFEDLEAIAIRDVFGWTQYRKNLKKALVSTTAFHPIIKSRDLEDVNTALRVLLKKREEDKLELEENLRTHLLALQ